MAVIIIYASIAGYSMHFVIDNKPLYSFLSVLNMSLATVSTPILLIRYIWTFFRNTPNPPNSISKIQIKIAKRVHSVMYLLMFIVFSSGYLMLEHSYWLFWITEVDNMIKNSAINQFFFKVHRISCVVLSLMIFLHILAVLKHQFITKNNMLRLML